MEKIYVVKRGNENVTACESFNVAMTYLLLVDLVDYDENS